MFESAGFNAWIDQYPEIVTILIIVIGWVVAILLRHGLSSAIARLNSMSMRWGSRSGPVVSPQFTSLLRMLVFWGVLLVSVILGMSFLGAGSFSGSIDSVWVFVTRLLAAFTILAAGHVLGLLARSLVSGLARKTEAMALSRITYALIISIAGVTAAGQLGLNLAFINHLFLALITIFFAGLTLAFALGARTLVANMTAQGELARYRVGDRIRVDGAEGTVVEIHRSCVVLSTEEGFARIPAAKFAENTVLVLGNGMAEDG